MPATELGHIISAVFRYSAPISQLLIRKFWIFYCKKSENLEFFRVFCAMYGPEVGLWAFIQVLLIIIAMNEYCYITM